MSNIDLLYKSNNFNEYNNYNNYNNYNKTFSPSNTTNYFENEVKNGLSFFQQNKLQSTLRNNYFNENNNNENNKKYSINEKNDMINIEAKKIIEREMNPYLSLMKKELNLIMEKFNQEFLEKNASINNLLNMKNEIEEIKRTNETIKINLEQKIIKNNDNLNELEQKMNNINSDINKFNQLLTSQTENNTLIPNINNEIEKIKQNLNLNEINTKNLFSEQKIKKN